MLQSFQVTRFPSVTYARQQGLLVNTLGSHLKRQNIISPFEKASPLGQTSIIDRATVGRKHHFFTHVSQKPLINTPFDVLKTKKTNNNKNKQDDNGHLIILR